MVAIIIGCNHFVIFIIYTVTAEQYVRNVVQYFVRYIIIFMVTFQGHMMFLDEPLARGVILEVMKCQKTCRNLIGLKPGNNVFVEWTDPRKRQQISVRDLLKETVIKIDLENVTAIAIADLKIRRYKE